MRKTYLWVSLLCMALVAAAFAPDALATELISNLDGNDGSQSADLDELRSKGMGFTMPAEEYRLENAILRLETFGSDVRPIVQIWNDVGGVPGAPLVTLINPAFAPSGVANYEFIPPGTFLLSPGTTYWLVAYGEVGGDRYDWKASSPAQIPTGIATHAGSLWDNNGAPPTNPSSIVCSYAINGTTGPVSVESGSWGSIKAQYRD